MEFDLDNFRIYPADGPAEADLPAILDYYNQRFFADESAPIAVAEFVHSLDGPAAVFPEIGRIEINEKLRTFTKLCCFLVLHELINNRLFHRCGKQQPYSGESFQAELKRLWEERAYRDIL